VQGRIDLGSGSNIRHIAQRFVQFKHSLHKDTGAALDFYQQSDPTTNRQFCKFWSSRDSFFRSRPADLDRRADIELTAGRHAVAERLSSLAAELREPRA